MAKAEVGRLLNLDFFTTAFLGEERTVPVREDLRVAFNLTRDAEHFESIAWLLLGSQIGYFPHDAASVLLKSRLEPLSPTSRESWVMVENLFPRHKDLARVLGSLKNPELARELFSKPPDANPLELTLFRTSLLLGADMSKDAALRSFTVALSFAGDTYWKDELLSSDIDPDEVMLVLSATEVSAGSFAPEVVIAGLIQAMKYMDRFQSVFGDIGDRIEGSPIPELRHSISAIVGWRINVATRRDRLLEVVGKLSREIDKFTIERDPYKQSGLGYLARNVERLLRYWNGEGHPLTAGAY